MRTIIAALAIVLTASVASAEPIFLSCPGVFLEASNHKVFDTIVIDLDIAADTIGVGYRKLHNLMQRGDETFSDDGTSDLLNYAVSITINRATGEISWNQIYSSNHSRDLTFKGVCKPLQNLF